MNADVTTGLMWLFRTMVGGSILLLLVWIAARCVRQPARRQRLAETGIAAALIVAILAILPGWIPVSLPFPQPSLQASTDGQDVTADGNPPHTAVVGNRATVDIDASTETEDEALSAIYLPLPEDTYRASLGGPNFALSPGISQPNDSTFAIPPDAAPVDSSATFSWQTAVPYVLGFYAVGASAVVGHWLLGWIGVCRMLRTSVQPPRRVSRLFGAMSRHMRRKPRVLASRKLRVPVSCGIWRPTVVLPASLCRRDQKARLRWVFAHELTHLRRGDAWSRILLGLGGAVYFFCPWFWGMRRQVQLCQEYVADAAAVSHDARHEDYAQFLLGLASAPAGPALAMSVRGTASDLFRRVTMLLQNPIRVERRCGRLWWVGTALSLLAVAVFVSGIGAAPDKKTSLGGASEVVVDDESIPAQDDVKRAKPEKKKEELKKKVDRKRMSADDFPFDELRKALENLPDKVDVEQIEKEVRKALSQLKERQKDWDIQTDDVKKRVGDILKKADIDKELFRKNAKDALEGLNIDDAQVKKHIQDAMKSVQGLNFDNEKLEKQIRDALEKAHVEVGDLNFADKLRVKTDDGRKAFRGFAEVPDGGTALFTSSGGQGRLGVMVDAPSAALREHLDLPKDRGLVITQVTPDSVAARAGIKANDILMELKGKPVSDKVQDLQKMVEKLEANAKVDAVVLRKGKSEKIKGIIVSDATPRTGPGGRAATGGFSRGGGGAGVGGFPGQPGFAPGGGGAMMFGGGPGSVMTTVSRTNERVTARHQEGNLVISLTGTVADGKAKMSEIHVQDGGKGEKYESVNDVPERYRDKVKNLVDMCEKGSVKIDVKSPGDRRSRDRDEDNDPIR